MATVTVIPQKINAKTLKPLSGEVKMRVCAYARVSTDSDEQFTSFKAQVDYYKKYIESRPDWVYVKTYTDEGISGTNTKHREGFNQMIKDALNGNFDMIVTKSVSRFARNTVDSLTTIRKLKELHIAVYFEKENINTLDSTGELLITIMSSFAQEESRSISENVTWGTRKRFSDGKVSLAYSSFLGFKKGEDGKLEVVEEEAKIVRLIYSLFIQGYSPTNICRSLEEKGIKSPMGKDVWQPSTINSILKNEKYKGDALLQKAFTTDFLTHKKKKNEGEIPQYYVMGSHEAIIEPAEWEMVQVEMKRRLELGALYLKKTAFSTKLVCGCCGGFYGHKIWHSNQKNRKEVWQCNKKYVKGQPKCNSPHLLEDDVKAAFIKAYNNIMGDKSRVIADCRILKQMACDTSELDLKIEEQEKEVQMITEHVDLLVKSNANQALNQEEFNQKYDSLKTRYDNEVSKYNALVNQKNEILNKERLIEAFIKNIASRPGLIEEWDDALWNRMIEEVIVNPDRTLTFKFYGGIQETI